MRLEHSSNDTTGPSSLAATSRLAFSQIYRPHNAEPYLNPPQHWPRRVDSSIRRKPLDHPAPETIPRKAPVAATSSVRRKPLQLPQAAQSLAPPLPVLSAPQSVSRNALPLASQSVRRKPIEIPAKDLSDLPGLPCGDPLTRQGAAPDTITTANEVTPGVVPANDNARQSRSAPEGPIDPANASTTELVPFAARVHTEKLATESQRPRRKEVPTGTISPVTKGRDVPSPRKPPTPSHSPRLRLKDDEARTIGASPLTPAAISTTQSTAVSPPATPNVLEITDQIASPTVSPAISAVEHYTTAELPGRPATGSSDDADNASHTGFESAGLGLKIELPVLELPPLLPFLTLDDFPEYANSQDIFGHLELGVLTAEQGSAFGRPAHKPIPPLADRQLASSPEVASDMPYEPVMEPQPVARGHARSHSGKGSVDMSKPRPAKPQSQKAMLSRALQKANTAVQLDNSQNFDGARHAYAEACALLEQVLHKTSAEEDRNKLEAIRRTYATRIEELDQMTTTWETDDKELPASPITTDFEYDYRQTNFVPVGTAKSSNYAQTIDRSPPRGLRQQNRYTADTPDDTPRQVRPPRPADAPRLQSAFSRPSTKQLPPRPSSPQKREQSSAPEDQWRPAQTQAPAQATPAEQTTTRSADNHEAVNYLRDGSQNSWLDPIDESMGSSSSSVHSGTSSQGYRRKHLRETSGNTETEFDTALDAAIEAAYDEGYEPMDPPEYDAADRADAIVSKALRKVELARERVRQTELEAYGESTYPAQSQHSSQSSGHGSRHKSGGFYDDLSSDEEERLLEEMTRDYDIDDFTMTGQKPANVPRVQEALTFRGTTDYGAKPQPRPPAPAKATRIPAQTHLSKSSQPSVPPPMLELPELPPPRPLSPGQRPASPGQTVRNRRLSGQNPKQLKIQTTKLKPPALETAMSSSEDVSRARSPSSTEADQAPRTVRKVTPPTANDGSTLGSPPSARSGLDGEDAFAGRSGSPSIHRLRKNFSSSSLKSIKGRNLSISNADDGSDMSPATPSTLSFGTGRIPNIPALPTPLAASLRDQMDGVSPGGLYLLDDNLHRPDTPGSPNSAAIDPPAALEPCPNDVMLRPFWLMRCLYQTLAHPRGGYLSTKLFVPRDVWRVKGAKLKSVEDKISNCDLLTAALLKLAKVDTCDADAVLDEMQSLEAILEQVQAGLTRKLGNEVGVQGSGVLFKEAANVLDHENATGVPRAGSVSAKSSFSWRRLRSKNSSIGLGGSFNSHRTGIDANKDTPSMPTLPMVLQPTSRPPKRDVAQAQFVGPNAHYMTSLARLFDAAQAIDQIARQVDDPGLRHADKTQVGLELCTRHAAEFFGFYVCRFVLADLGLLLDKFIKRGSEWVLA